MHKGFKTAAEALAFITGGRAYVTMTSAKTGKHFTYRVATGKDDKTPLFVGVLEGPDNYMNYRYIGFIPKLTTMLIAGRRGKPNAPSFKALTWVLKHLVKGRLPEDLTIHHEGKCGMCGRKLTDPGSIECGIGPICREKGVAA